jgi:hypothetical protein
MRKRTTAKLAQAARMAAPAKPQSVHSRPSVVLPVSRATGGTLRGVDLSDSAALLDIMEGLTRRRADR